MAIASYSSIGALTAATTTFNVAAANPFRFSSEYADDALGLVYYNYRHYEPVMGRWLQRDFLDESDERLRYVFSGNIPTQVFDYLGLSFVWYYKEQAEVADFSKEKISEFVRKVKEVLNRGVDIPLAYTEYALAGLNTICECEGKKYYFKDAIISVQAIVHVKKKYGDNPPKTWVDAKEQEHVEDLKSWCIEQKTSNRSAWDEKAEEVFKGISYNTKEDCLKDSAERISQNVRDSLLLAGVRSAIKRHKNGAHTWKGRNK